LHDVAYAKDESLEIMSDIFAFGGKGYDAVRVARIGELPVEAIATPASFAFRTEGWVHSVTSEVTVLPREADLLLGLWDALPALPDDEAARCHIPRHGFELIERGEPVFSAAVCFECSNISIGGRLALEKWRTFGATSRQGQAFKMAFERLLSAARPPKVNDQKSRL